MKYCSKCGRELLDEAIVCPGCGCYAGPAVSPKPDAQATPKDDFSDLKEPTSPYIPQGYEAPINDQNFGAFNEPQTNGDQYTHHPSPIQIVAKVFMIIGTVATSLYMFLIPLAWCLPMTITYCNKINKNKPISVGFKVCSLIFVSLVGGILMLCDDQKQNNGGN